MLTIIRKYLPDWVYEYMADTPSEILDSMTEIRFRSGQPVIFTSNNIEYGIDETGLIKGPKWLIKARKADSNDIHKIVELVSNFSLYAWQEELRNGFITIPGGHRVGLCGKAVVEGGKIKTLSHISSINFRIKHQVTGCSREVFKYISLDKMGSILIISPPGGGKTTLLRDMARTLSNGDGSGNGLNIGIVDERSEIAGCFMGIPQNDVGIRTDVIDRCPKAEGMLTLLRSMSPQVIAVDEIGGKEDIDAIEYIINSGVRLLCTVHGFGIEDVKNKPYLSELIKRRVFSHYIVLEDKERPGSIRFIYDESFIRVK
ncbi:MAG: stage III sporulation protein AA [Clostridiales bacterium]|jgi:stage III sporulation protein AA|nr:stage III sporulation protein AA [Clostridiales bacterium]